MATASKTAPQSNGARAAAGFVAGKYVYDFAEGSREMRNLLGGKGANICEMTRLLGADLVPAGFVITTEACVVYMTGGGEPPGARDPGRAGARAPRSARRAQLRR